MENRKLTHENHFAYLPNEVLDLILEYVELSDFSRLAKTCKSFKNLVYAYPVKFVDSNPIEKTTYGEAVRFFKESDDKYRMCVETYHKHKQSVMNFYLDDLVPENRGMQALNLLPASLAVFLAIKNNRFLGKYSFHLAATGTVASAVLDFLSTKYFEDIHEAKENLDKAERHKDRMKFAAVKGRD